MFTNLAYMNFIRIMKCRYNKAAISIASFIVIIFFFIFRYIFQNIPPESHVVTDGRWFQTTVGTMFLNVIIGLVAFMMIFVTCDYYKFRLYINIQNSYKSNVLFCASEYAALILFASLVGIFVPISYLVTGIVGHDAIIDGAGRFFLIYLASVFSIFTVTLPTFFVATLIKKIWPAIIVFLLQFFLFSFALGLAVGLTSTEDEIGSLSGVFAYPASLVHWSALLNPGDVFYQFAVKSTSLSNYNLGLILVNATTYVLVWFLLTCLVTRKKVE
ncbi:MAG: hypothetical protein MJ093_06690 [Saccharofermentans sp.]|nr:hypothetical protein [Saccharofermentans sp.]